MVAAPGAGFRGGTRFRTKNNSWRPKKRSSLQNKWVFGPEVREDQKKGLRLKISEFLVQMRMGMTKQSKKSEVYTTNRWSNGFIS